MIQLTMPALLGKRSFNVMDREEDKLRREEERRFYEEKRNEERERREDNRRRSDRMIKLMIPGLLVKRSLNVRNDGSSKKIK